MQTMASFPCLQQPLRIPQANLRLIPSISAFGVGGKRVSYQNTHIHLTDTNRRMRIRAIDAAQALDLEGKRYEKLEQSNKLKIGIVGFGNFGQFIAKTLVAQGHTVLAHSRSDYFNVATQLGIPFFSDPHDLCEQHPEVILLCTSILSTESVLRAFPFQSLKRSTLFVDVLSVKEFPKSLFLEVLPPEFDILCTHPMFGPESGKHGWNGLNFVYDRVRIGDEESRVTRCNRFLNAFAQEGCNMVEMYCHDHDKHAAESQFITHLTGRILEKLSLDSTPINTKGYESLLDLVSNTSGDTFELFYGLYMYNKNALEQLQRLDMAFESLKKQLFGQLHTVLRNNCLGQGYHNINLRASPMQQQSSVIPVVQVVNSRERSV